jgi:hypothetical protein
LVCVLFVHDQRPRRASMDLMVRRMIFTSPHNDQVAT